MKIYSSEEKNKINGPVGIGLGNFDGVHIGHAALIEKLVSESSKRGIPSMIYTFREHPARVLHLKNEPLLIMDESTKMSVLEEKGVDITYLENFTREYAGYSPEYFMSEILSGQFNAQFVVTGKDFTFGKGGKGTVETLKNYAARTGAFEVFVVELVKIDGITVSSTEIRKEIAFGNMQKYSLYTGRMYSIPGKVEEGRKVGRTIGFPTANIIPNSAFALPPSGVYATFTKADGKMYKSITNIGNNPTFGCERLTVETHLLDFDGELYGKDIEVFFARKIRNEIRFAGADELKKQIEADLENVRRM